MVEEMLILVDEDDNQIGTEEKVKCHLPDGKLHRAFTALLFDEKGKVSNYKTCKRKNVMARRMGWNICESSKRI